MTKPYTKPSEVSKPSAITTLPTMPTIQPSTMAKPSLAPVLFVSHGAPLFAVSPGTSGPALTAYGKQLQAAHPVKGIVILSPHWMTERLAVMRNPTPETYHDFGGFPPALYELQYPAPGDIALSDRVQALLTSAGLNPIQDSDRPLDHGAWVPLLPVT